MTDNTFAPPLCVCLNPILVIVNVSVVVSVPSTLYTQHVGSRKSRLSGAFHLDSARSRLQYTPFGRHTKFTITLGCLRLKTFEQGSDWC